MYLKKKKAFGYAHFQFNVWIQIQILCYINRSYYSNPLSHTVSAKNGQQPPWCEDKENSAGYCILRPEVKCVMHIFASLSSNMKTWREGRGCPEWDMQRWMYTIALLAFMALSTKTFYLPHRAATATCFLEPSGDSYSQVVKQFDILLDILMFMVEYILQVCCYALMGLICCQTEVAFKIIYLCENWIYMQYA